MGYPMAGHLKAKGHETKVYNRTIAKAERWVAQHGGESAPNPRAAADDRDVVFACVGNDQDLRAIALGPDGAFAGMRPGAIFVDHTTASAMVARELHAEAKKRGLHFIDAPVSGGQLTKMVNQICVAGAVQGLSEALQFGRKAGLDLGAVVSVISKGAAQSWQMDNRSKTMIAGKFDYGFAVDWMRKDLGFCLDEARRNGAHLPTTALIDQFYSEVQKMGGGRWDTSSLIARLEK
jgi:3-hydroxyisobutyrate dehydrogenase